MELAPIALVLTAGLGTRLRPLSWLRAKPALPVAGEPLVGHVLRRLASHGVREAILNLHHRPETIAEAVGDGSPFGIRVRYSWEQPVLGSAGGPARAFTLTGSRDLLIVNGDTLTDVDVAALYKAHCASGALVTLAVIENPSPQRYGGVLVSDDGIVEGFTPRGRELAGGWHFVGVQVVRRDAFAGVATDAPSESVGGLYPRLIATRPGSVRAWRTRASFDDIGTPLTYLETCLSMSANITARLVDPAANVGDGATVERSVVWAGATIGAGAWISECIVAGGARVAGGSRYHRAIVLPAGSVPAEPLGRVEGDVCVWPIDG